MVIQAVRYFSTARSLAGERSNTLTVMQMRQEVVEWLSPPDPSVNYYAARDTHHKGTAVWFIEGNTFRNWKESGSLLWIHGKRTFPRSLRLRYHSSLPIGCHSGLRQKRPYVCHSIRLASARVAYIIDYHQFCGYPGYRTRLEHWASARGLFLF